MCVSFVSIVCILPGIEDPLVFVTSEMHLFSCGATLYLPSLSPKLCFRFKLLNITHENIDMTLDVGLLIRHRTWDVFRSL